MWMHCPIQWLADVSVLLQPYSLRLHWVSLTARVNLTFHSVFLLRALRCLFITPTPSGNFSQSHLFCPHPFSQPCSFSKPVVPTGLASLQALSPSAGR